MKTKFYMLGAFITGLMLLSCSNDNDDANMPEVATGNASLTVTVHNGKPMNTRATAPTTQQSENTINSFTVYVVNKVSDIVERTATFTPSDESGFTQQIEGLSTGDKQVVVVANPPAGYTGPSSNVYSAFASDMIDLETQQTHNRLTMSGESEITLTADGQNSVDIELTRIVAKVELTGVTVSAEAGHTGEFTLNQVHIMKARGESNMGIPEVVSGGAYYGGTMGAVSQSTKEYLTEDIPANYADADPRYFYVFPNDNTENNATLMVIEGTYNGDTKYYPFYIRHTVGETEDEQYINRNDYYRINVNINRPGDGTDDPEQPLETTVLDVSVDVRDWNDIPDQEINW